MIEALVKYIVTRAVESHTEMQTYEWMLRYAAPPSVDGKSQRLTDLRELSEHLPESGAAAEQQPKELPVMPDSPVYPAVSYVDTHRDQMSSMREMASLCHLSPSYFSRIFLRELGENYTDWMNRRKMGWAKELLRESSESVTRIATELGYVDTSYFIKVFKKFEGITPLVYRQHKYR